MTSHEPVSEAGFSLVETVAAMGILALAAIPLMQLTGDATRNAASLESRLLARTVAENVMVRTLTRPGPLDAGIATGTETQLGRTYAWQQTIAVPDAAGLQLINISVQRRDETQMLARLTALKYHPVPLAEIEAPDTAANPDAEAMP